MAVSNGPAQFSWPHGNYTVIGTGNMAPEEWYNMANESQRYPKLAGKHSLSTYICWLKHTHTINTILTIFGIHYEANELCFTKEIFLW